MRIVRSKPLFILLSAAGIALSGVAFAYSSGVRNNLLKARDATLEQRADLERANRSLDEKIAALQRQKNSVRLYLIQCDKSLRDLDAALRNAQY